MAGLALPVREAVGSSARWRCRQNSRVAVLRHPRRRWPRPACAVTDAERIAVYQEFRAQFDARQYAEAQPLAEQLVALTEEQYGAEDAAAHQPADEPGHGSLQARQLPGGHRELPAHRCASCRPNRRWPTRQQIRPLHGLGISLLGASDPESAVVALKRAADLSRNTDGLFNIGQVEFIDALIDAYGATGRWAEAEKESPLRHARRGSRLRPQLDQAARPLRQTRALATKPIAATPANAPVYERALNVLSRNAPRERPAARRPAARHRARVPPRGFLRRGRGGHGRHVQCRHQRRAGLQRWHAAAPWRDVAGHGAGDHRRQHARGPGAARPGAHRSRRLVPVASTCRAARSTPTPKRGRRWPRPATRSCSSRRACSPIARRSARSIAPSSIRPKPSSSRSRCTSAWSATAGSDDVTSPTTDVPDSVVKNSVASMKRSRFAPRIENGVAVPTDDVVFLERVLVRAASPESGTSSDSAAEKPAEESKPDGAEAGGD